MGDDEAVTLQSGDNETFSISKVVACHAGTIKEMLEDTESDATIPLPNVQGPILSMVIEYCTWHVGAEADGASEDAQNDWQAKFVEVDQGTLCHLIVAANYLNIAPLVDLTCKALADMVEGKTPEEIRAHFNIQNDFTPEEEEEVRRQNAWCEGLQKEETDRIAAVFCRIKSKRPLLIRPMRMRRLISSYRM